MSLLTLPKRSPGTVRCPGGSRSADEANLNQLETTTMTFGQDFPDCECTYDYGPCEIHGELLVQRDGASSHTADELILILCQDLVDLGAGLSPYGADVLARATRYAAQCVSEWGTMWFRDDGETRDELVTLGDQLEADLGVSVIWDGGYRIVRPTDNCPLYV